MAPASLSRGQGREQGQGDVTTKKREESDVQQPPTEEQGACGGGDVVAEAVNGIAALDLSTQDEFPLVEFIKFLENPIFQEAQSHYHWMLELDKKGIRDKMRAETLKKKIEMWLEEKDSHLSVCQAVTQRLALGVYNSLIVGASEETYRMFDEAQAVIETEAEKLKAASGNGSVAGAGVIPDEENSLEPMGHLCAYMFMRRAGVCIITCFDKWTKKLWTFDEVKQNVEEIMSVPPDLLADSEYKATILALKGLFANQLGRTDNAIELFRMATEENPACFDWAHHQFTAMRRKRRESNFKDPPSDIEISTCKRARDLRPNYWRSLLAYALLVEDTNRCRNLDLKTRAKNNEIIIECLSKARKLAPNNLNVNLRLAEALTTKPQATDDDYRQGQELYYYCMEHWPGSSQVMHKLGKFYERHMKDGERAIQCFEEALEIDPTNYPCLMDLFRKKFDHCNSMDIIHLIDKYLHAVQYKPLFFKRLISIQGFLLWRCNETKRALELWINVFQDFQEKDPESKHILDDLKKTLDGKHPILPSASKQEIDVELIKTTLRKCPGIEQDSTEVRKFLWFLNTRCGSRNRNDSVSSNSSAQNKPQRFRTRSNQSEEEFPRRPFRATHDDRRNVQNHNENGEGSDVLDSRARDGYSESHRTRNQNRFQSQSQADDDNNWRVRQTATTTKKVEAEPSSHRESRGEQKKRPKSPQRDPQHRNPLLRKDLQNDEVNLPAEMAFTPLPIEQEAGKGRTRPIFEQNERLRIQESRESDFGLADIPSNLQ